MEDIIIDLETLRNSMPVNWTIFNLNRLKQKFMDFTWLISRLPEEFLELKHYCEQQVMVIKLKIDAIDTSLLSWKVSKNHFQEAVGEIKAQIDMILSGIRPGLV